MGLFKRKKKTAKADQVYDLKEIVWRGGDTIERIDESASMDMIADAVEAVVDSDEIAKMVREEAIRRDGGDGEASTLPSSTAVKTAVERVVREELSSWLNANINGIIAESISARKSSGSKRARKKSASRTKPPKKTKTKIAPKL